MRILFVCHRLPYPPNRGDRIRSFNMLSHLSKKHSVVVACPVDSVQEAIDASPLEKYCEDVICEVVPDPIRWVRASQSLLSGKPSSVAYFWSPRLYSRIWDRLFVSKFDVILVHCAFVAEYVAKWKNTYKILDYVDIDSVKWSEYSRRRSFPLSIGYALEAKKLRRYEREVAGCFHHC